MSNSLGWINGEWGSLDQLKVPLCDRGLTIGDGIFETILIYQGEVKLMKSHLCRWKKSASLLKLNAPPSEESLEPLISKGIQLCRLNKGNGVLRLNWTRGDNQGRGIHISSNKSALCKHRFWLEIITAEPTFNSISATISSHEKRNASSLLSQCKTFNYGQSIQAKIEAIDGGFDEALLLSTTGELSCGSASNLIIKRNKQWITPRLKSGCLPGVMRQQGLNSGLIKEERVRPCPEPEDEWLLINSLGCKAIHRLENQSLKVNSNPKDLWLELLNSKEISSLNSSSIY